MTLPDLPKKYKRTESEVDSKVANKLAKLHPVRNWALEVKIKGGKLKPHQKTYLKQVENGTFKPYKIPDMGRKNCFDFFHLGDADAIVCTVDGKKVTCVINDGVAKFSFTI